MLENLSENLSENSILGEGAQGCVTKKALECKEGGIDYAGKLSKIMTDAHAADELQEHKRIHKIDPKEQFYLGVPIKCSVARTEENVRTIGKCKDGAKFLSQFDNLSLLIMKNGGDNFSMFANRAKKWSDNETNGKRIELFWIECHRILLGIKVFLSNGIIHQDLKPQNLVYNETLGRANFIDFGHMDSKLKISEECKNSIYHYASYHWSYPWEYDLLNYDKYEAFAKIDKKKHVEYLMYAIEMKIHNDGSDTIHHFLSKYSEPKLKEAYLSEYSEFLLRDITLENYDKILNKSLDTVDIYGTGMAFAFVLLHTQHLVDAAFFDKMTQLCFNMTRPNVFLRFGIDAVLSEFESILFSSGFLAKHQKKLENHQIKDSVGKPLQSKNILDSLNLFGLKKATVQPTVQPIVQATVQPVSILKIESDQKKRNKTVRFKKCGPGRFLNPLTNRCKTHKKTQ